MSCTAGSPACAQVIFPVRMSRRGSRRPSARRLTTTCPGRAELVKAAEHAHAPLARTASSGVMIAWSPSS